MKISSQKFRRRAAWSAAASLGALFAASVLHSATRSHATGAQDQDKQARASASDVE